MATSIDQKATTAGQEEEVDSLRDYFKDNIRILSSIGQFSYILKIRADQYDVSVTLQLDKSYPSKAPEIMITAPRLTPDQILLVQQLLQSYSETLLNQPMILPIYSRLLKWFDENNIQALTVSTNNNNNNNNNNSSNNNNTSVSPLPRSPTNGKCLPSFVPSNNHNKAAQPDEQDHDSTKRCAMKTAEDAISRIESDARLDKRHFRVGYLDQLLGLQEKPLNELDFKTDLLRNISISSKYRIQYLKYAQEVIWDKDSRTDLLFGSTGNQQTIYDIVKRHENLIEVKTSHEDKPMEVDPTVPTKRYLTSADSLHKPNYLLSIPITDPSLVSHYVAYREHLLSSYPSLFTSSSSSHILSIDPHYLHLSLLTLRLESSLQIEQCILALKRIQEEIHYHCSYPERICLEFNGIDTFHNKTLFIKCLPNARLDNLRTLIVERLCEQQQKQKINDTFFAGNYQDYIPHITLFKSKRKLSSAYPNETKNLYFGKQCIDALHLSSINTNEIEPQKNYCIFKLDLS